MAKAVLENYNGYPAIMIDGKPYPPMMMTINNRAGTEPLFEGDVPKQEVIVDGEYYKNLGESGIKIYFLICDTDWLLPGSFEMFQKEAEAILKEVPDAYFMVRIGLHPPNEWIDAHPEETLLFSDGTKLPCDLRSETYKAKLPAMYSLCSQKWREDAGTALMETYDRIESLPYADRIIGYFLAAGGTSEWYYLGREKPDAYSDCSEAFRRNFEEYLRETYKDEAELRAAWNDPNATFEHPRIPDLSDRVFMESINQQITFPKFGNPSQPLSPPPKGDTHIGIFTNMNHSKNTFDYFMAWHTGSAKSVNYFAKLIKDRSRDKLVGTFFGSTGCIDFIEAGTSAASLPILDQGYVDFFATPTVYQNRQIGGFAGIREPADSFRLRNCMYIVEDDTRTHAENAHFGNLYEVFSLEDTLTIMKRDFGRDLCEDLQSWWFDQLIGGKRYKFKEVYDLIARQQQVAKEAYEKNRIKQNEIAFIYDEESFEAVSKQTSYEAVEFMRDYEISRIGASCDSYYHNDMGRPDMPSYKLYVFCNIYVLSKQERQDIINKLKKDHAIAIWLYAPGVIDPKTKPFFDIENMSKLTGFQFEISEGVVTPKFKFIKDTHDLTDHLDMGQIYGYNYRFMQNNMYHAQLPLTQFAQLLYPAFYPTEDSGTVLGRFLQNQKPAFSIKEMDGWTSIFCGARILRSDIIREAARYAGCHIFCDSDDVIYASRNYVTIHAASTGKKVLKFPFACTPVEIYEEKAYGEKVMEITLDLLKGETKTFELKR